MVLRGVALFQKNEITEHIVYSRLAQKTKGNNAEILEKISQDELNHYDEWKKYTETDIRPDKKTVIKYLILSAIFGLTFVMKIMESGEKKAFGRTPQPPNILGVHPEIKRRLSRTFTRDRIEKFTKGTKGHHTSQDR